MVAKFGEGAFLYDGVRFGPTEAELQAHEKRLAEQEKGRVTPLISNSGRDGRGKVSVGTFT